MDGLVEFSMHSGAGCLDRRHVKSYEAGIWEVRGVRAGEPRQAVVEERQAGTHHEDSLRCDREGKVGSRAKRTDVLWCQVNTVVTGKWIQTSLFPLQYQISLWEEGYLLPSFERPILG